MQKLKLEMAAVKTELLISPTRSWKETVYTYWQEHDTISIRSLLRSAVTDSKTKHFNTFRTFIISLKHTVTLWVVLPETGMNIIPPTNFCFKSRNLTGTLTNSLEQAPASGQYNFSTHYFTIHTVLRLIILGCIFAHCVHVSLMLCLGNPSSANQ